MEYTFDSEDMRLSIVSKTLQEIKDRIKLDNDTFNNFLGKEEVWKIFGNVIGKPGVDVEDYSKRPYYENDFATLIVSVDVSAIASSMLANIMLMIGQNVLDSGADEFSHIYDNETNKFYIRLWWD